MEKLKNLLAVVFRTEFLLKILIIAGVIALLRLSGGNFNVRIDHYHTTTYGGFELKIKQGEGQ